MCSDGARCREFTALRKRFLGVGYRADLACHATLGFMAVAWMDKMSELDNFESEDGSAKES